MSIEMIDIYDEMGRQLGISLSRDEVHKKGLWHKTVHIWILNSQGELLIQRRSSKKESYPDVWDISCAGHIVAGTGSIEAAIRECKEELGLDIKEGDLKFLFTSSQHFVLKKGAFVENEFCDVFLLCQDFPMFKMILQIEEVSAVAWLPYKNLERKIKSEPGQYVPHTEEYKRLFEYLDKNFSKPLC